MLGETPYAAVTMDLTLPGEDGLTFIHELQQNQATRHLPIVVVSATAEDSQHALRGSAVGLVDWLNKPIDQQRLLAALRRATGHKTPNILYVEDDEDLAEVIAGILGEKFHLSHARSLAEAEHRLDHEEFDLVILDLGLPDGSGLRLLPSINRMANPPAILVFSAHQLSPDEMDEVSGALLKSQTDNLTLLQTVNTMLESA
jgi:DNA-binding response OmpR family regulator